MHSYTYNKYTVVDISVFVHPTINLSIHTLMHASIHPWKNINQNVNGGNF